LLAGARGIELVSGHKYGIEFLLSNLLEQFHNVGHMSPQTMIGFLVFGIGMLAIQRADSRKFQIIASIMASALLLIGLGGVIGYWLGLQYIFESLYLKTGLIWMAFHTAIGLSILGLGLLCLALHRSQSVATTVQHQAALIYRTTLLVLTVTAVTTGLTGISYLEKTSFKQSSMDIAYSLGAIRAHINTLIDDRTQRALVASLNPELKTVASRILRNPEKKSSRAQQPRLAAALIALGFSGIAVETGKQRSLIAGRLIPDSIRHTQLDGKINAALAWDNGYYLRVRIPLNGSDGGFLVLEQTLPYMNKVFADTYNLGATGALSMCARMEQNKLQCFPNREQAGVFVIPDNYQGKPLPMAYALAKKSGIDSATDYRGHHVLAAFGPVADTGLGLVLRKDLAEIYAPVADQVTIAIPLIMILVALSLWLIRARVRPLITNITNAHAAESTEKARFDAAIQSSPDGFVIYESIKNQDGDIVDFRCVYLNQHAEVMGKLSIGKSAGNLVGHSYLQTFPERRDIFAKYRAVALTRELQAEELSFPGDKDATLWYLRQAVPLPHGIAVTYRDITREKLLVQQLESSNRLRTAIVESAAYSIISTDVNGIILTFNKAAERMLWYCADELVGKATPTVFHDAEEIRNRAEGLSHELGFTVEPGFEVFVAKARENFVEEHEWTYVRKDGSRFPVLLSVTALYDENKNIHGFLGIAYDISERKRADEYIRHIALHDVLTGLPNRVLLDDRVMLTIEQQHRNNTVFALAMMDIDHFKHINDSMGHHIGDSLLKGFVERVKSCLRPTDTLARMGGDEFVLLLPGSDAAEAESVVRRALHELTLPINVGVQEVHITSSVGISIFPDDGHNMNELLRCADVAMYWVKENGRNGYKVFSREMESGGADRLRLERDLHIALDNGGFSLLYQPKVDLKSNTVFGVEALLRMRMADGQFTSPADFIPLTEETGLIIPIGKWVLETACRDAIRMQQSLNMPLTVAVNISPRQFMSGELVGIVQGVLQQTGLDPSQLELEITEGVLMDEQRGVATALSELHELGVKIAIDDFGTGYSSLGYLKRYPICTLKIDQSFVRDVTNDEGDAALVVAIIAMGHSLKIHVVAEGIETDEQLAFVVANNCDRGQGFHIGRPMPFDELLQWISSDNCWKPGMPSVTT
jgi:diguanylate cyclase (GGDEF)-like protein/PAS domain S-box-containing protein